MHIAAIFPTIDCVITESFITHIFEYLLCSINCSGYRACRGIKQSLYPQIVKNPVGKLILEDCVNDCDRGLTRYHWRTEKEVIHCAWD